MARPSKTGVKGLHRDKRGRYCIDFRFRDPETKQVRRYTEDLPIGITAAAAKERARQALNAAYAGSLRDRDEEPRRLHAALEEYLTWCRTNRPNTYADRRYLVDAIKRHMGNPWLQDLNAFAVERFKRDRASDGVTQATVNRAVGMFKHFVGLAAAWGWITDRTAKSVRGVKLFKEPPGRVRYLTGDEQEQLLAGLRDDVRPIAVTALLTGMRLGEIVNLTKNAVDLDGRLITLTKTKNNRVRRVPIHDDLVPLLRAAMERSIGPFVFTNLAGRPHSHQATVVFRETVRKLGIQDLRFHDLRHDFATKLRRRGVGLDVIAQLLGHTTLAMTQRYAHIGLESLRDAVDQLDGGIGEAERPSRPSNTRPGATGVVIPLRPSEK